MHVTGWGGAVLPPWPSASCSFFGGVSRFRECQMATRRECAFPLVGVRGGGLDAAYQTLNRVGVTLTGAEVE